MMPGQSSSPVMHDACEDLGQNYLKAGIIQSVALADYFQVSCTLSSQRVQS